LLEVIAAKNSDLIGAFYFSMLEIILLTVGCFPYGAVTMASKPVV